jgi:sulfopyruvate decarboxylase TPP-binding subunit
LLVQSLKEADVSFVSFLPESRLSDLVPLLEKDEFFTLVRASHEGSAVCMASGAALVGQSAAVYMEASGLMASLFQLQGVPIRCGIPLLLLVSHVGSPSDSGNGSTFSGFGTRTEPLLRAMGIQYEVLDSSIGLSKKVHDMVRASHAAKEPACLLFTGEFTDFEGDWL